MKLRPLSLIDFYKVGHIFQYEPGTSRVYANFTARSDKHASMLCRDYYYGSEVVVAGIQGFIKEFLIDLWGREFFDRDRDTVVSHYARRCTNALGPAPEGKSYDKAFKDLHDLGYLPLEIRALPEGTLCPIGVPMFTIENTHDDFYWLTNFIETCVSQNIWKTITVATLAHHYRCIMNSYAVETGVDSDEMSIFGHDFSARGLGGSEDSARSNIGHLFSFAGGDTVASLDYAEDYYGADSDEEMLCVSVPATEHSVMCIGTKEREIDTYRRLINEVYPTGIVSIVSDTWDFWRVITEYTRELKNVIEARPSNDIGLPGKLVFRPDSGDPVKIICGDPDAKEGSPAFKGAVECLWEVFGGTNTSKGFKVLNQCVGLIYGDSITPERADMILSQLAEKGFAANNVIFGIGSFTYQHITRDTFGMAMKATWGRVNGEGREIFKDPITDDGTKKSLTGRVMVVREGDEIKVLDRQSPKASNQGLLRPVFRDGALLVEENLATIRQRLASQ